MIQFVALRISFRVRPLELAFETKSLRNLCEDHSVAEAKLGVTVAENLRQRIADLWAARTVFDLPLGVSVTSNACTINLAGASRLRFLPNHPRNPVLESDETDWAHVNRIRLIGIE